jgi:hypothetical protein
MGNNVTPTYAKSQVKSGLEDAAYAEQVLDGIPAKKGVEAIEKENEVKNVNGSIEKPSDPGAERKGTP